MNKDLEIYKTQDEKYIFPKSKPLSKGISHRRQKGEMSISVPGRVSNNSVDKENVELPPPQ